MRKLSVVPLLLLPGLLFAQLPGSGVETTFANQDGRDVLISRNVLIERGVPS